MLAVNKGNYILIKPNKIMIEYRNIARYKDGKQEYMRCAAGRHNYQWVNDKSKASKFFGDSLNTYMGLALKSNPKYIIQSLPIDKVE